MTETGSGYTLPLTIPIKRPGLSLPPPVCVSGAAAEPASGGGDRIGGFQGMETGELAIRVALSFLTAGTWISLATLAGEKLGSRAGGLIVNLPSNIVVSFLFVALTRGVAFTADAARAIPLGMAINTLFIFIFILAVRRSLPFAVLSSLAAWFAVAAAASAFPIRSLPLSLVIYLLVCVGGFLLAEFGTKIRSVPKKPAPWNPRGMLIRALFAGTVVASAVLAAQIAPPYVTGILASFPAVMMSTFVILTLTQGPDFTRATGKVLMLSSSNIIVYAFGVANFYPRLGIVAGTLISFAGAVVWISLFLPLVRRIS